MSAFQDSNTQLGHRHGPPDGGCLCSGEVYKHSHPDGGRTRVVVDRLRATKITTPMQVHFNHTPILPATPIPCYVLQLQSSNETLTRQIGAAFCVFAIARKRGSRAVSVCRSRVPHIQFGG
jgi:hypothetical protein